MTGSPYKALCCTVAAAVLINCVADSAAVLKGRVLIDGEPADSACKLRLYAADTDRLLQTLDIRDPFDEMFVIDPKERDYYVTISCDGVAEQFQSATLRLPIDDIEAGTDLGTVSLSRSANGASSQPSASQ